MSSEVKYGPLTINFLGGEEVEFQLPVETPLDKNLPPGEERRAFLPTLENLNFQAAVREAGGQVLDVTVKREKVTAPIISIPLPRGKKLDFFPIPVSQKTTFGYRLLFPTERK